MQHDLTIRDVPLKDLAALTGNPRRGDVAAVSASIQANGIYQPIIVNAGTHTGRPMEVIAGNHRAEAARALGLDTIPAVVLDVTEEQATRIALADNRTSDLADYDNDALVLMLQSLDDLTGTGYDDIDLQDLLGEFDTDTPDGLNDPDDVPATPTKPITRPGDIITLGPHRVVCGDSTLADTYQALLGTERADAVWTDPPYGVSYEGKTAAKLTIENDRLDTTELRAFLDASLGATRDHTKPGAMWYVAAPHGPQFQAFVGTLTELDIWRQTLVWVKDQFALGHSDYHYRHEAIFYGWTPGAARLHPTPDRTQDTVLEFDKPQRNGDHPTMKPVPLIAYCLGNSANHGDTILDPFGGSGSTLIAAHQLGMNARLIELDPVYVDVICRRYQEHTGDTPTRRGKPVDFTRDH